MYQALDSYLVLFGLKEACYFFPGVLGRFIHYFGKMSFSVTFCLLLLVLCSSFSIGRGVWFSAEVQKLLDEILEEYSTCAVPCEQLVSPTPNERETTASNRLLFHRACASSARTPHVMHLMSISFVNTVNIVFVDHHVLVR